MADGRLIVLYGVNNLGKSTQLDLLEEELSKSGAVIRQKYPRYDTPTGQIINAILREGRAASPTELQQWTSLNIWQDQDRLHQELEQGATVLLEDYWGGTIAWGMGNGVRRADLEAMTAGLRRPEVAVLLDGERFTAAKEAGHVHEQNDDLADRVQQHMRELAAELGWQTVDANQSIEQVHSDIMKLVTGALKETA